MEREREKMGVQREVEDGGTTRGRSEGEIGEGAKKGVKGKGRGCVHALWLQSLYSRNPKKERTVPGRGQLTVEANSRSQARVAILLKYRGPDTRKFKYAQGERDSQGVPRDKWKVPGRGHQTVEANSRSQARVAIFAKVRGLTKQ